MLGVIIHFLIQLTIVVLTAGEDFAERRLLFVFNCRSNMMLQASLDCFLGSPNKEWKKKCQQQLHPSWVWSILSIIKGGRTWFSRLNWICLFDFYFLFHRTEFKYTSESGGKKNTGKKKKKLVNWAALAWCAQHATVQGFPLFHLFHENQAPCKEMQSESLSSIISCENLTLCIFHFQASRLSSLSREMQAWISLKHFNYFSFLLSLGYL